MAQANVDPAQVQQMMAVMLPIMGGVALVVYALIIVPLWIAMKKAGLSPWLSLLTLVPGIGILIPLYILAFAKWRVVPLPAEYPPYPAYGQPAYPPQVYTEPGAYTPAPQAPLYPPTDPSSQG